LDVFYPDRVHLADLKQRYEAGGLNSVGDGELKKLLIKVLDELIAPIREKRAYYQNNINMVIDAIES
jgi:tryptophanyl-tRNA synthetase